MGYCFLVFCCKMPEKLKKFRVQEKAVKKHLVLALGAILLSGAALPAQDDFDIGVGDAKPGQSQNADVAARTTIQATPAAIEAVVAANDFAVRIFRQVAIPGQNVFLSPYSINVAFNMAMAGASDYTLEEFLKVFGHPGGEEKAQKNTGELLSYINSIQARGEVLLAAANAIWPDKKFKLLPAFEEILKQIYQVEMQPLDFAGEKSAVVKAINSWVEEKTAGKIAGPFNEGMVDEKTGIILVNAIYFKGNWAEKFDKSATQPADFHVNAEKTVKVSMMRQSEEFMYVSGPEFKAIELPYAGNDLGMLLLLPAEGLSVEELETKLSPEFLDATLAGMHKEEVMLGLPSFKLETEFSLNSAMKALGLSRAFSEQAEFNRITAEKGMFISSAIHKAFVEVNEEGTEAAAITMMEMQCESYQEPPSFIANRPFIFIIRERQTGCILFIGRLANPPEA